ncbi:unnamed protein product [Leptidea sinapis]|uniref:Uncharacterized protein n=1 Tax=Leptidea sinapis TaxID=189913 RepID=A0A5E4PM05_9NEOP|nr:unnamed protein product [Leptidea sinapis]
MPCKCLGISNNACNCNKLSTLQSYLRDSNDLNITFGTSNGTAKMTKNQCFLEYLGLNSFYDMCATYNLNQLKSALVGKAFSQISGRLLCTG